MPPVGVMPGDCLTPPCDGLIYPRCCNSPVRQSDNTGVPCPVSTVGAGDGYSPSSLPGRTMPPVASGHGRRRSRAGSRGANRSREIPHAAAVPRASCRNNPFRRVRYSLMRPVGAAPPIRSRRLLVRGTTAPTPPASLAGRCLVGLAVYLLPPTPVPWLGTLGAGVRGGVPPVVAGRRTIVPGRLRSARWRGRERFNVSAGGLPPGRSRVRVPGLRGFMA